LTRKRISTRSLKKKIKELLKLPDIEPALEELSQAPTGQVINSLFTFLYNEDPVIKWNAVTAFGVVASRLAREDMESARVVIRRLMWNLNEESGGIGWGSAEAMGEILALNESLAGEYSPILLSYARVDGNYQEYEFMQRGVIWAIGRLARARPGIFSDGAQYIMPYLNSGDAFVRGLAAWVLGLLGAKEACPGLEQLAMDENLIDIYLDLKLIRRPVKDLATDALKRLNPGGGNGKESPY
jgi:hypothetical protein